MRSDPTTRRRRSSPSRPMLRAVVVGLAAVVVLPLGGGCASRLTGERVAPDAAGDDPQAQMTFWHALPDRRAVSNDEAFHALLLFADGRDPAADYPARVAALRNRGMLPAGFDDPAEAALRRGTLAVALARALSIDGGLTLRVFGPSARYATRELEFAGVFPPSSPHQTFSGPEFLGIMGRAEDYQRGRAAENQVPEELAEASGRDGPAAAATPPEAANGPTTRPSTQPAVE